MSYLMHLNQHYLTLCFFCIQHITPHRRHQHIFSHHFQIPTFFQVFDVGGHPARGLETENENGTA